MLRSCVACVWLLIAPIESQSQGNRFGTGIYLSDSFNKALGYTSTGKKNIFYWLILY